jgi:hypothetical protein
MNYEQMGMAALIPGMQYLIDKMQAQLDELREQLAAVQNGGAPTVTLARRGRPPKEVATAEEAAKFKRKSKAVSGYWAKMTDEERSVEMKRRRALGKANRQPVDGVELSAEELDRLHPRDARSPRHQAYVRKLRKSVNNFWARMTDEQRAEHIAKTQAGRHINGAAQ